MLEFPKALSMDHSYLIYLLMTLSYFFNYADDNNIYSTRNNLELAKMDLQTDFRAITDWFFENYKMLNPQNCCYMCIGKNFVDDTFIHNGKTFKSSKVETILGVTFDNKLNFDSHIKRTCQKAGKKLFKEYQHIEKYQLLMI